MKRELWIQVVAIYWPIVTALALAIGIRPKKRQKTGLLFSLTWVAGALPLLDGLAQMSGAWSYGPAAQSLGGMPLSLYFGWLGLWGAVATLLSFRFRIGWVISLMAALDFVTMPRMQPLVRLHPVWWGGEIALLLGVLLPALLLAKWTADDTRLPSRAILLAICFSLCVLLIPALVVTGSLQVFLARLNSLPSWLKAVSATVTLCAGALSWSAMRDLALDGGGTPVPLDPTRRLVDTGTYAFVANPMQIGMTIMLFLEAAILKSGAIAVFGVATILYSAGFAWWSERLDLTERFGDSWAVYRTRVRAWIPSVLPCEGHDCILYVDAGCNLCSQAGQWLLMRHPVRLEIRDAGEMPFRRITWLDPVSGRTESGAMAVARALQHLHLGWAVLGWMLTLPGIAPVVQICMDASGAAPAIRD